MRKWKSCWEAWWNRVENKKQANQGFLSTSQWGGTEKAVLVGSDPNLTESRPSPPAPGPKAVLHRASARLTVGGWHWGGCCWELAPHTLGLWGVQPPAGVPSSPCPKSGPWTPGLGKPSPACGGENEAGSPGEALSEAACDRPNTHCGRAPGCRRAGRATPALGSRGIATWTTGQPTLLPQLSDLFWLRGKSDFCSVFKVFLG